MQSSALVFIIDDDASMRQGVGRWLESVGYKSEAFESAIDFLARKFDFAAVGLVDADQEIEKGGFPRAVGSNEAGDAARRNLHTGFGYRR